jgi:hypothetical protein
MKSSTKQIRELESLESLTQVPVPTRVLREPLVSSRMSDLRYTSRIRTRLLVGLMYDRYLRSDTSVSSHTPDYLMSQTLQYGGLSLSRPTSSFFENHFFGVQIQDHLVSFGPRLVIIALLTG